MKLNLKNKAIKFRKQGLSYSEILTKVPVAKSTLSLWLRSVGMSHRQVQRLTLKRILASKRGGEKRKQQRLIITRQIKEQSLLDIKNIIKNELFIIGIMLYWAEGAKSKEHNPSQGFIFSNSDPWMIKIIIKWMKECLEIPNERILFEIYVHDKYKSHIDLLKQHWSFITGFSIVKFDKIYFKREKVKTNRKNIGVNYWGQLRVKISKSTNLNRQINGWIEGIYKYCGVV